MLTSPASQAGRRPALAFIINSVEFVNHYRLIWQHLGADSFDIIAGGMEEKPDEIRAFVASQGFACRTIGDVLADGRRYPWLVSHHPFMSSDIASVSQLGDRHVRFMYGLGKAGWNFSEWNRLYDAILCFGPHQKDALARVTDSLLIEVGYPRFDRFFHGAFDRTQLQRDYGCDPAKRTLVWLPTWSDLASISRFQAAMSMLTGAFNVVVKLHPFARQKNPREVAELKQHRFNAIIDEPIDNVSLYVLADWIVADYGGPMFGALYTDRKLLLLDLPDTANHEFLGKDSPDLLLRQVIPSVAAPDSERIMALLLDDELWARQQAVAAALRREFFAPYYGCSAEVASAVLTNIDAIVRLQGRANRS
jgi:hypothetical protein